MLEKLIVKNFAIIENLEINFTSGMNVISGETGAGKSLVIDTILLLAGARADADMIRHDEKSAYICGHFNNLSQQLKKFLQGLGIETIDTLVIEREIRGAAKNIIKVNNISVTLTELKEIGKNLLDIHLQHDLYRLFNIENYFDFLDGDDLKILELKNDYLLALDKYNSDLALYKEVLNDQKNNSDKLEYLEYEKQELAGYNLKKDEDVLLAQELVKLRNFDKIFSALKNCYEYINGNNLDSIYEAAEELEKIANFDENFSEVASKVKDAYYNLDEVKSYIYREISNSDFDENQYAMLEERDYALSKLKEKYHRSLSELIEYYDKLCLEIEKITNYDGLISDLKTRLENSAQAVYKLGMSLHEQRQKLAVILEKNISTECKMLDLPEMNFKVAFQEIPKFSIDSHTFYNNGLDVIDFLVSFNKGEPLKPLAKIASGGELSRVMLAFKSIFSAKRPLSLMVFDEIDTGVSGEAALMIAKKIYEIATKTPVICITHLPQVAAIADTNLYVYKEEVNNRTITHIKTLDSEEKIMRIAQMLSGNQLSSYAIMHAKELVKIKK